jgi:2-iminobutanoate/2-iminopropanoate deaminase
MPQSASRSRREGRAQAAQLNVKEVEVSSDHQKAAVRTADAPAAIGPYSQAVAVGNLLFCSGQIPLDPAIGELVVGGFEAEVERVFANLRAVVAAAGFLFDDVVKVTVYMTDLGRFPSLNEIYARQFNEPFPARATVGVSSLPKGAQVEVDLVAMRS